MDQSDADNGERGVLGGETPNGEGEETVQRVLDWKEKNPIFLGDPLPGLYTFPSSQSSCSQHKPLLYARCEFESGIQTQSARQFSVLMFPLLTSSRRSALCSLATSLNVVGM